MGFPLLRSVHCAAFALALSLAFPVAAGAQQSGSSSASGAASTGAPPTATATVSATGTLAPPGAPADSAGGTAPKPADVAPAVPAEVPDTTDADEAQEWADWDRVVNESNTITGGTGLLKTQHAQTGAPGQFRIGFVSEWFSAGFLCSTQFPCPNPVRGRAAITSDTMNHVGGTLSIGGSLASIGAGTLDGYASISAFANSDTANTPSLLQVLGDTNLGVKYVAPVGNVLHLGLFTELWLINGTGSVGLDGGGTSAKFGGVATIDLRGLESRVPLRFSLNTVYSLDNTADVLNDTETARGQRDAVAGSAAVPEAVTRIERFGLAVNRVDHVDLLLGLETFLADERVRPFVESKVLIPTNRQGYTCRPSNVSKDNCLATDALAPASLTVGGRFFPWKRGFSLLAALDIGLTGTSTFVEELQPLPPWTLYLGAGWAVDTWDRPPVVKTKLVEKVVEKNRAPGHVVGFVHEKDKNDPVVSAIVSYRDRGDLSPLATGADGKFADDLPPGQYTFDIKADLFKPASCDVTVPAEGGNLPVDCPLEALPRVGIVLGHVRDADTNQPIGAVPVVLSDAQRKELRLSTDSAGAFRFEAVAPGSAEVRVTADGYLVLVTPADVKARQENVVDLMLRPKPKQANVQVTATEITIKQQIQFALDSAVILPESFGLLTEIADTLIRHPELRRVEVQGHTDNSGTSDHNKLLSEQRAEAVRAWLVQHGVPADRLLARGYGQDRPLVPNVTVGNRARNRRVQFIILEKDTNPAALGTQPASPPGERKKTPLPGF